MSDEKELIERFKSGDDTAFELLYEKYKNLVVKTAYLITGNKETAEDIAQDTFIEAYSKVFTLRDISRFKPWLLRILTRKAYKSLKNAPVLIADEEILSSIPDESMVSPIEHIQVLEEKEALIRAVNGLPHKMRICVILYYYNEMSIDEIANVVGIFPGTVKSRLHNAKKRLYGVLMEM